MKKPDPIEKALAEPWLIFEGFEQTPENAKMTMVYDGVEFTLEEVYDILRQRIKQHEGYQHAERRKHEIQLRKKDTLLDMYRTQLKTQAGLIRELLAALDKASDNVRSANLVHEITDLLDRAKAAGFEP
jgi:tryptophan 2,3-dioxygenase